MAIGRATALFGNTSGQSQSKNLVEFRAGKMDLKGKMVHPDKRKGLVYVHQSDDSLMHFCWKDRTSGNVVDDLIIFPDDVEYKRVVQCTTGRVFVLKFKSTTRKLFFWMQEPKTDKDEEYCKKVNEYLNNPPAPGSNRSGGSTPGGLPSELSNLGDSDIQTLLNNMSQQQLVQLFGNVGGLGGVSGLTSLLGNRGISSQSNQSSRTSTRQEATTTVAPSPTTTTTTTSSTALTPTTTSSAATPTPAPTTTAAAIPGSNIQLSDLQTILSGISVPPSSEETVARSPVDLSTAFNVEAMQPILTNPEFIERLQTLIPQGDISSGELPEQLKDTLQSPQFQQAMSMFSAALQSGQLGPLIQQFGLGDDAIAAATQGDIEAFVRAMQTTTGNKSENPKPKLAEKSDDKKDSKDKDEDEEEDMALD